jgi:hypothetical protein
MVVIRVLAVAISRDVGSCVLIVFQAVSSEEEKEEES